MSTLDELRGALRVVEEHLHEARGLLTKSRTSLAEAEAALTRLDPENPEAVVPPGLRRAEEQIERTLARVNYVSDTLLNFESSL